MKSIVIYSSQTGFTEKYAIWIAERLGGETMTLKEAEKRPDEFFESYDALIYGGWAIAGKIHKADWFIERMPRWKGKKLALFCVGAMPSEPGTQEDIHTVLQQTLTDEQHQYAKVFYCPGGLNYEKMPFVSKLAMKAFAAVQKIKAKKTPEDQLAAEMLSKSYDNTDKKFVDPIVAYITNEGENVNA